MFINLCVCPSVPYDFEGGVWDFIVLIPDHYLSIYLFHPKFYDQRNEFDFDKEIFLFCDGDVRHFTSCPLRVK